jgi:hypothetical protein
MFLGIIMPEQVQHLGLDFGKEFEMAKKNTNSKHE